MELHLLNLVHSEFGALLETDVQSHRATHPSDIVRWFINLPCRISQVLSGGPVHIVLDLFRRCLTRGLEMSGKVLLGPAWCDNLRL